jgi:hypothetical protein
MGLFTVTDDSASNTVVVSAYLQENGSLWGPGVKVVPLGEFEAGVQRYLEEERGRQAKSSFRAERRTVKKSSRYVSSRDTLRLSSSIDGV